MQVEVQLFAGARDAAGLDRIAVELPDGGTVAMLRRAVAAQYPALAHFVPHLMFAVNLEYATDETVLTPDADVAAIPPLSGG